MVSGGNWLIIIYLNGDRSKCSKSLPDFRLIVHLSPLYGPCLHKN